MRSIFKKVCKVLGIEKFMYAFPPADGKETIGILISDEDAKGIKRGDIAFKIMDPIFEPHGCRSAFECGKCGAKHECDSSVPSKAGTKVDGINYIQGPCCCIGICVECRYGGYDRQVLGIKDCECDLCRK